MKTCDEMFPNMLMPGVTVKSHAYFTAMESNSVEQPANQYANAPNPSATKEMHNNSSQSYKGFYTWLSSPKAIYNQRKSNNVAVITPTQHHP